MNKKINISKITGYDSFKCSADKCKFTCCAGWDVNVDDNTYNKWRECDKSYILKNIIKIDDEDEEQYFVNKETRDVCPFLDKKGLCNIVKKDGEEYLSLTCKSFPRVENIFEDIKELTLSCACPEVVEIISNINEKINMVSEENYKFESNSKIFEIRERLVSIIQNNNFPLYKKLIICYEMILNLIKSENINKVLEVYKDKEYINELSYNYDEFDINIEEAIEEVKYLFLDITQNYKDVIGLENSLKDIYEFAEDIDANSVNNSWKKYINEFEKYDNLIENCIVSKIFSNCINDDIEEIALSFELIILEYILIRYAIFLKCCINKRNEVNIQDVKDYIVVFSRVISNNDEAVFEFLEEGFGHIILEYGYMRFIMM